MVIKAGIRILKEKRFGKIRWRIRDNFWRTPGLIALMYMVLWWIAFALWYVPTQVTSAVEALDPFTSAMASVFITVGLGAMVFSVFLVYPLCFKP